MIPVVMLVQVAVMFLNPFAAADLGLDASDRILFIFEPVSICRFHCLPHNCEIRRHGRRATGHTAGVALETPDRASPATPLTS